MADPYLSGIVPKNPFHVKRPVTGAVVAVLNNRYDNRGITLMPQLSRAVLKNQIHELMVTDESVSLDETVNRIFCIGFFEVSSGGVIVQGDTLLLKDQSIGKVIGFNGDHMPNHLNIVIHNPSPATGAELGIDLNDAVIVKR